MRSGVIATQQIRIREHPPRQIRVQIKRRDDRHAGTDFRANSFEQRAAQVRLVLGRHRSMQDEAHGIQRPRDAELFVERLEDSLRGRGFDRAPRPASESSQPDQLAWGLRPLEDSRQHAADLAGLPVPLEDLRPDGDPPVLEVRPAGQISIERVRLLPHLADGDSHGWFLVRSRG